MVLKPFFYVVLKPYFFIGKLMLRSGRHVSEGYRQRLPFRKAWNRRRCVSDLACAALASAAKAYIFGAAVAVALGLLRPLASGRQGLCFFLF